MCAECMRTPCDPRCPNAPEPEALYDCSYCNEGIKAGDMMVRIDGAHYHLDCLAFMDVEELMELLGLDVEEVTEDDY